MQLMFNIVYAAHANGTHHKLALDALRHLQVSDAEAWQSMFLKHAGLYLEGSKAPDTEFKDFKNHVLHVRDGYWGGAPEKAESWYAHLVEALQQSNWEVAAYAAGVLSHYVTDPIHPFHTAQSEAESNVHRAVEWSINRGYDALRRDFEAAHASMSVAAGEGSSWLRELIIAGAERSNLSYERLIAHYDIHSGVTDPPSGLDQIARADVGALIHYASRAFGRVLDRAIAQSGATPPQVSLGLDTLLAGLKVPLKCVLNKLADAGERRLVQAQYDELMSTGRVDRTLTEDDRAVRDLFAKEVLEPRAAEQNLVRAARLADKSASQTKPAAVHSASVAAPAALAATPPSATAARQPKPALEAAANSSKFRISLADDVERAPVIGPVMAERLGAAGIKTISDLLAADPHRVAAVLGDRRVSDASVLGWQQMVRLMLAVPGLNGSHAQLLVGAGYSDVSIIRDADAGKMSADILNYAATAAGQRIVRDGAAPELERIKLWIGGVQQAQAA